MEIRLIQINGVMGTDADARSAIIAQLRVVGYFFHKYLLHLSTSSKIRVVKTETIFIIVTSEKENHRHKRQESGEIDAYR